MDGFLGQALMMLAYHVPELLVLIAGLSMLWSWAAPTAPGRRMALSGIGVLLVVTVLRMGLGVFQVWAFQRAAEEQWAVSSLMTIYQAVSVLLTLAGAVGLLLLVWGAATAMRPALAATRPVP